MKMQEVNTNADSWTPSRQEVSEFMREQTFCTLAYVDQSGAPQAATVAFSETADGNYIIGTDENSRKARNIKHDPRVAMVVTDDVERYTVQLEGEAKLLSTEEFEELSEEHYAQLPASRPFKGRPGQVHIFVTPLHLRFSDCNPHPWVVTEFDPYEPLHKQSSA